MESIEGRAKILDLTYEKRVFIPPLLSSHSSRTIYSSSLIIIIFVKGLLVQI